MSILSELDAEIKKAMKSRDGLRLSALRLIKAQCKNKEIDLRRKLDEQAELEVLTKMAKQRRESIEMYQKGGREDLAAKEVSELKIIESYLPQPLSEGELDGIIADAVGKLAAGGVKDMGRVMKEIREKTAGRVDGKALADRVKKRLS